MFREIEISVDLIKDNIYELANLLFEGQEIPEDFIAALGHLKGVVNCVEHRLLTLNLEK